MEHQFKDKTCNSLWNISPRIKPVTAYGTSIQGLKPATGFGTSVQGLNSATAYGEHQSKDKTCNSLWNISSRIKPVTAHGTSVQG